MTFISCAVLLAILSLTYILTRAKPVYLLNYSVFQPPPQYALCSLALVHFIC